MNNKSFVKLYDKDELRSAWLNYNIAKESFPGFMYKVADKWLHYTLFHHRPIYYFFNKKRSAHNLFLSKLPCKRMLMQFMYIN